MGDISDSARVACEHVGAEFKDLPPEGRFYTLDLANDPRGRSDARIKIFPGGQSGVVFNHKSGNHEYFFANGSRILSNSDREKILESKAKAELIRQHNHARAAHKANFIHQTGKLVLGKYDHNYTTIKKRCTAARLAAYR